MNVDEWNRMHDAYMREYGPPPKRQPCWKRPKVFYTALFLVIAAMIGLAVTGILMGKDGTMIGWRPNRGSNGEGGDDEPPTNDVSPVNDGNGTNVEGTGGFMNQEPSPSPTVSPTVAPTNSPTKAPTRGPRTTPLAFYVMGDSKCMQNRLNGRLPLLAYVSMYWVDSRTSSSFASQFLMRRGRKKFSFRKLQTLQRIDIQEALFLYTLVT